MRSVLGYVDPRVVRPRPRIRAARVPTLTPIILLGLGLSLPGSALRPSMMPSVPTSVAAAPEVLPGLNEEALEELWEPTPELPRVAEPIVSGARRDALDVLGTDRVASVQATPSASHGHAADPIVAGSSGWIGDAAASRWQWQVRLRSAAHIAVLRARWGSSPIDGVPARYAWSAAHPDALGACPEGALSDASFKRIDDAHGEATPSAGSAAPTRRSWFVDVDACAFRLSIEATHHGAPVLRELHAYLGATNELRAATVLSDDGSETRDINDGHYGAHERGKSTSEGWVGVAGRGRWVLTMVLAQPAPIDRVRLVLGLDATSVVRRRGVGRTYGVARSARDWALEGSVDGATFTPLARAPRRAAAVGARVAAGDPGIPLKLRRVLIPLAPSGPLRALRLTLVGATDDEGRPSARGSPMIRELEAYSATDPSPVLPTPWVLSVNANPSPMTSRQPGAELANDVYFTKFLQMRLAQLLPAMARDDRFSRRMGGNGELIEAPRDASSGEALESIEGDDPALTPELIEYSSPRPLVVLSGSGDWDFAAIARPTAAEGHFRWDPLRPARDGGIGQLSELVQSRGAPMLGFCGGAQILALLEAAQGDATDAVLLDRMLQRADGRPLRQAISPATLERAWPGDGRPRAAIAFDVHDPLFADIAAGGRAVTYAMPEWHADAVRVEAFGRKGRLSSWSIAARSFFCGPKSAPGRHGLPTCTEIPQAFHSTGAGFPIMGAQFHAEQRSFDVADARDPAWSTADPALFIAAAWELAVDAWLAHPEPGRTPVKPVRGKKP